MGEFSASEIEGTDFTPPHAGCEATIASLTAQLAARDAEVAKLKAGLGLDRTWPLLDVLAKLADGVEHLLDAHDCDGHGWEEYSRAAKEAREIVASTAPRNEPEKSR